MISANTYSEVFEVLSNMDKSIVMKIPLEILEIIKNNRNLDYVSKIDKNDLFNLNNLSEDAINVLAWLDVNYWITDEKKEKINEYLKNNNEKVRFDGFPKFNQEKNANNKMVIEDVQVKIYKENIIVKIINGIKKLFNK